LGKILTNRAHWNPIKRPGRVVTSGRRVTDNNAVKGDSVIIFASIRDSDTPAMLRVRPITLQLSINGFTALLDLSRDDARRIGEQLLRLYREVGEPAPLPQAPKST
jgi:hypothetical protein